MKIIKNGDYIGTEEGRLYLDGFTIKGNCPNCKEEFSQKLVRDTYFYDYYDFNKNGGVKSHSCYCDKCDNDFKVTIKINIELEVVGGVR